MITHRKLKKMQILLVHDDGKKALIVSPDKTQRIGIRLRFGWLFIMAGAWIMFPDNKRWSVITDQITGV